jgi:hypothetical protein
MAIRSDVKGEKAKQERAAARNYATGKPSAAPENEPTNEEVAPIVPEPSASTLAVKASNPISSDISLSKQKSDQSLIAHDQYQGIASRVLEETRDNVRRAAIESMEKLPVYTETLNSFQVFNIKAYKEVAELYIGVQQQLISSFQSAWVPYWEKTFGLVWTSFMSPQRVTELYGYLVAGLADGLIMANRTLSIYFLENIETLKKNMENAQRTSNDLAKACMNLTKIELGQTDTSGRKSKMPEDEVPKVKTISELDT